MIAFLTLHGATTLSFSLNFIFTCDSLSHNASCHHLGAGLQTQKEKGLRVGGARGETSQGFSKVKRGNDIHTRSSQPPTNGHIVADDSGHGLATNAVLGHVHNGIVLDVSVAAYFDGVHIPCTVCMCIQLECSLRHSLCHAQPQMFVP